MASLDTLYIAATSLITPVGLDSVMTSASVAAGISAYQTTKYYNKKSEAIIGALVPDDALPPLHDDLGTCGLKGDEKRSIRLCHTAFSDILPHLPTEQKTTLFLAGPENIPARPSPFNAQLLSHIMLQCDAPINLKTSRFAATGRAGAVQAMRYAFDYMENNNETHVLVGGVDTFCNPGLLSRLDVEDRLLSTGAANGFAIGEGAGFILLSRTPTTNQSIVISRPGIHQEPGHRYNPDEPYLGEGLSHAATMAISNSPKHTISTLYSSMNGESFFAKEHGVMMLRNHKALTDNISVLHPADCYGDLGAATGIALITLSALNLSQTDHDSNHAHMICCSSDLSARAAVCVHNLSY